MFVLVTANRSLLAGVGSSETDPGLVTVVPPTIRSPSSLRCISIGVTSQFEASRIVLVNSVIISFAFLCGTVSSISQVLEEMKSVKRNVPGISRTLNSVLQVEVTAVPRSVILSLRSVVVHSLPLKAY